ncbi:MAG: ATP phosphoribosyltransferase [Thermoplasmatota archaeon]
MTIRIAVPNKGRLAEATVDLFAKAGIRLEGASERRLISKALDGRFTILFVRAQDIAEFVDDGVADVGITGRDLLMEASRPIDELLDLGYGRCRLSVAVPNESPVKSVRDIPKGARIASSFPKLTQSFFRGHGNDVRVVEVSGATEITPHIGVADAIVDLVSSGSTLAMNHLREVEVILQSSARLVANRAAVADPKRAYEIRDLTFALSSVVAARGKRYLMANVPRGKLDQVRKIIPGISGPTIMELVSHGDMVAAHAVIDEGGIYETVNQLKQIGATGILVLPIERLVS